VLVICRMRATGEKKRELHTLLYGAALAHARTISQSTGLAIFAMTRAPFSEPMAGKLIFLGRSAGMQAISGKSLLFIRRFGKESDLVADGKSLATALRKAALPGIEDIIAELEKKDAFPLIPLSTSPDSSARLHDISDAAEALGLDKGDKEKVMAKLKEDYVYDRKDITPETI
jgi:hypothetical protein